MTVKEKFERLVSEIENLANSDEQLKPRDIGERMANISILGYRDLNTIFTYLTGTSLLDYIRERQIMAAYIKIINMPIFNVSVAISVSGLDNQSSFGKKFKERFGITPKEAFNEKDMSKFIQQLTWNSISNDEELFKTTTQQPKRHNNKFGFSNEEYQLLQQAEDLQLLYEFDDIQSEIAFKIAKEENVDIKRAFKFVDDYFLYMGDDFVPFNQTFKIFDDMDELKFVYFNVVQEIETAQKLVDELKELGHNPREFTVYFLKACVEEDRFALEDLFQFAEQYEEEHGEVDSEFEDFITSIKLGIDECESVYDYFEYDEDGVPYDEDENSYDDFM